MLFQVFKSLDCLETLREGAKWGFTFQTHNMQVQARDSRINITFCHKKSSNVRNLQAKNRPRSAMLPGMRTVIQKHKKTRAHTQSHVYTYMCVCVCVCVCVRERECARVSVCVGYMDTRAHQKIDRQSGDWRE